MWCSQKIWVTQPNKLIQTDLKEMEEHVRAQVRRLVEHDMLTFPQGVFGKDFERDVWEAPTARFIIEIRKQLPAMVEEYPSQARMMERDLREWTTLIYMAKLKRVRGPIELEEVERELADRELVLRERIRRMESGKVLHFPEEQFFGRASYAPMYRIVPWVNTLASEPHCDPRVVLLDQDLKQWLDAYNTMRIESLAVWQY